MAIAVWGSSAPAADVAAELGDVVYSVSGVVAPNSAHFQGRSPLHDGDGDPAIEGEPAQPDDPQADPGAPPLRTPGFHLEGRPRVSMVRTAVPPTIDGDPGDAAWEDAPVIEAFTQVNPVLGAAGSERTQTKLLYDDDNLYVLVRAFDRDPAGVLAKELQRDAELQGSDRVAFVIDTFNDGRNGFFFEMNPAGARRDALVENQRNLRFEWDGIWRGRARRDNEGWTAEFRIPFKTVSFNPEETTWGFNVSRFIRRKNEDMRWAAARRDLRLISLSEAGLLTDLRGMRQGLGLDIVPAVVLKSKSDGASINDEFDLEPSLDIFYKPSAELTVALTINTDFAETEVDERQVNLTRFPLFFPERRDFFLQDAGIFDFASIRRSPLPFFSRRIGIGPSGEEQDIVAGAKVTGRVDDLNFGLLNVLMDDDPDLGAKNFTVARGSFNVLEESSVGVIATHGDPRNADDSSLVGADFNYRNSSDFGQAVVAGGAWVQQTFSQGDSMVNDGSDETAFGGRVSYDSDDWRASLNVEQIGADLNPALGFVRRRGVRSYFLRSRKRWREEGSQLRRFDIESNLTFVTNLSNETETFEIEAPQLIWETQEGDEIRLAQRFTREVLFAPFTISDGVIIPVGDYRWSQVQFVVDTSAGRPLALRGEVRAGGFFSGDRLDLLGAVEWRPSAQLFASAEFEHNDISLDEGAFETQIGRARVNVSFSPDVTWSNFVQWDNVSEQLGVNSRVKWIVQPGNEVFLVFNQGFDTEDGRFASLSTEITVKAGLTFRF